MLTMHYGKVTLAKTLENVGHGVVLQIRREHTWSSQKAEEAVHWNDRNDSGSINRFLIVKGELAERATRYQAEWTFPLDEKFCESLRVAIQEAINSITKEEAKETALERYIDVDFVRIGIFNRGAAKSSYLEFTKDGQKIRAEYSDILHLDGFSQDLKLLFTR